MTALLDATDSQMANLAGLVESLQVAEATLSSMQAARDGLLALAARLAIDIAKQGDHPDRGDHSIRTVAAEIAAVQRASDRTVERRLAAATVLVELFPAVWAAQGAGRISAAHARVIVDAGSHLPDAQRAAYAAIVVPLAEVESPSRLRPLARRIAERFAPTSITSRHRKARAQRRVWVTEGEDGMAALHTHAPAALIHGMFDRLSQMAHLIRTENLRATRDARRDGRDHDPDDRTVDEIRADLLADLVLTGTPTGHDSTDALLAELRAHITVTVPVTTLMHNPSDTDEAGAENGTEDDTDAGAEDDAENENENDAGAETENRSEAEAQDDTDAEAAGANADAERGAEPGTGDDYCDQTPGSSPTATEHDHSRAESARAKPHRPTRAPTRSTPPPCPPQTSHAHRSHARTAPPPAELDGVIPIDADTARRLAGHTSGWDRVLTHPITGNALAVDRYRPSTHLRRHLRARDQRCRFPGCGIPARKSDLDHTHAAAAGGDTADTNLATLCRRHHTLKHHTPWHVEQGQNGILIWTSPTGRSYTDTPPVPNTVTFTDTNTSTSTDAAPAPF